VSVVCPSAVATSIADSQRTRAAVAAPDEHADAVEKFLADFCAGGLSPDEVAGIVVGGIRRGDFLIPTRDTFGEFIRVRADALARRELPPFQMFD
jgi:hypothetical protein